MHRAREARRVVLKMARGLYDRTGQRGSSKRRTTSGGGGGGGGGGGDLLRVFAVCLLTTCKLEAVSFDEEDTTNSDNGHDGNDSDNNGHNNGNSNGHSNDDDSDNNSVNVALVEEALLLLEQLSSTATTVDEDVLDIHDCLTFIQGWCGMLAIHGEFSCCGCC